MAKRHLARNNRKWRKNPFIMSYLHTVSECLHISCAQLTFWLHNKSCLYPNIQPSKLMKWKLSVFTSGDNSWETHFSDSLYLRMDGAEGWLQSDGDCLQFLCHQLPVPVSASSTHAQYFCLPTFHLIMSNFCL